MANYQGIARSNYFPVHDVTEFKESCARYGLGVFDGEGRHAGTVAIYAAESGWPTSWFNADIGEDEDLDIGDFVAEHLVEGHVAVLEEVGWEKLRYLNGCAVAINSHGDRRRVFLDDIYDLAAELGHAARY